MQRLLNALKACGLALYKKILYLTCYTYLYVAHLFKKRRFDLYDISIEGQPEKIGFFVPQQEWEMDTPQTDVSKLITNADDAFCFGVNSKSDGLAIYISRQPNGHVRCNLFLRFADGREYTLPDEYGLQKESSEDYTFGSSRLKLQCLSPMRRWRIFFNGLLKYSQKSNTEEDLQLEYQHVRFTFIFTASSGVFDFSSDMSKSLLAQNVSYTPSEKIFAPLSLLQRMKDIFDSYEQSGMILGTVKVGDEEEKEIYLWGNRARYMGKTKDIKSGDYIQFYGNFENGAIMHLGILNLPGITSRFLYGYVMRSDGFMHPIETLVEEFRNTTNGQYKFSFFCGGKDYQVDIWESDSECVSFGKEFNGQSFIKHAKMELNGKKGMGFVFNGSIKESTTSKISCCKEEPCSSSKEMPLSVAFDEENFQTPELAGSKGYSLMKLYSVCEKPNSSKEHLIPPFSVSKGVVVTTEAYKLFIKGSLSESLEEFQKAVWSSSESESKILCQKMVNKLCDADMPAEISECLENNLKRLFSDNVIKTKFAVRSSATGEDTDQTSAAGQMETFLGVKGVNQILEAVKKCWASQFTFQAVQYKRCYGQLINAPMAVVVQEMVSCDVAGVAFTCDPVNGDPSYINITANWGLGESVVSALAEPDTIILKRNLNKVVLHSKEIGKKKTKTVMNDDLGIHEIEIESNQSSNCCLSEEMSVQLGKVAIQVEELFGSPRDIEWGVVGSKIFLFQARPITSLDIDTDFETKHCFDTYMRIEKEYVSKANLGEVMPGATSPLGIDILWKVLEIGFGRQKLVRWDGGLLPNVPYFLKRHFNAYNHCFFCLIDSLLRFDNAGNDHAKSMVIAVYGRDITNDELANFASERYNSNGSASKMTIMHSILATMNMFIAGFFSRRLIRKLDQFEIECNPQDLPEQIMHRIGCDYQISAPGLYRHVDCSISSSNWNMKVLSLLIKTRGELDHDVYSDFGYLLSTCTEVESADVPSALQKLGMAISECIEPQKFQQMDVEDALNWLLSEKSGVEQQFHKFLHKHGHRCWKEFDVYSKSWGDDPKSLVKMLQAFVATDMDKRIVKDVPSFSTIISKMKIKLNFLSRLRLRWILPNCRRAVRERESSKSALIKSVHKIRRPLYQLAEVLVKNGYLPDKELLYFLCIEEIMQLIRSRSPRLVARALKRKKVHKELDSLIFPEILSGIPKPINLYKSDDNSTCGGLTMTGIPVSQGIVKGIARVIMNLEEATNIQPGDILITYSTDIGWSPYFPLLSGVATELGGLISHGAVVAREYGLPCVVGLHGGTQVFKSGDLVVLNGNKGTLTRVET